MVFYRFRFSTSVNWIESTVKDNSYFPFRSPSKVIYANCSIKVFQFSPNSHLILTQLFIPSDWQINVNCKLLPNNFRKAILLLKIIRIEIMKWWLNYIAIWPYKFSENEKKKKEELLSVWMHPIQQVYNQNVTYQNKFQLNKFRFKCKIVRFKAFTFQRSMRKKKLNYIKSSFAWAYNRIKFSNNKKACWKS